MRHMLPVGPKFRHALTQGWCELHAKTLEAAQLAFQQQKLPGTLGCIQIWTGGAWVWVRELV